MILPKLKQEVIITSKMSDLVESQVTENLNEDEYLNHFHILKNPRNKNLFRRLLNKNYNGATIILKQNENGQYSFQLAKCSSKENFIKVRGRYYAYLRAKEHGFIPLNKKVTDKLLEKVVKTDSNLELNNIVIVNYIIKNYLNKVKDPQDTIGFNVSSDLTDIEYISKSTINKEAISFVEESIQSVIDEKYPNTFCIKYSYEGKTVKAFMESKKKDLTEEEQSVLSVFLDCKAVAVCNEKDKFNKLVGKYIALSRLFTQVSVVYLNLS